MHSFDRGASIRSIAEGRKNIRQRLPSKHGCIVDDAGRIAGGGRFSTALAARSTVVITYRGPRTDHRAGSGSRQRGRRLRHRTDRRSRGRRRCTVARPRSVYGRRSPGHTSPRTDRRSTELRCGRRITTRGHVSSRHSHLGQLDQWSDRHAHGHIPFGLLCQPSDPRQPDTRRGSTTQHRNRAR